MSSTGRSAPRQRDHESEPFECPEPITCQFPLCGCGPPEPYQDWLDQHQRAIERETISDVG
jgi:hypothetical protein